MLQGYLFLVSNPSYPGYFRLVCKSEDEYADSSTRLDDPDSNALLVVRFTDIDTAKLHAHSALNRHLVDIDTHLYKVEAADAIAALETIELPHERVYIDPTIEQSVDRRVEKLEARLVKRHRLQNRIWQWLGWFALIWLTYLTFGSGLKF
jgi:hypothetical protein